MEFKAGTSMDILLVDEFGPEWDSTKKEMRNYAYRRICAGKPFLVVGDPTCKSWSVTINLSHA